MRKRRIDKRGLLRRVKEHFPFGALERLFAEHIVGQGDVDVFAQYARALLRPGDRGRGNDLRLVLKKNRLTQHYIMQFARPSFFYAPRTLRYEPGKNGAY